MHPSYFYKKVTLKMSIPLPLVRQWYRRWKVPTTLLKLPKNWVIYIGGNVY